MQVTRFGRAIGSGSSGSGNIVADIFVAVIDEVFLLSHLEDQSKLAALLSLSERSLRIPPLDYESADTLEVDCWRWLNDGQDKC